MVPFPIPFCPFPITHYPFPITHPPFGIVRSHAYVGKRTERTGKADYLFACRYPQQTMEVDHERKSIARNEYFIGNYGPHALRTAFGHRADPVRDRIRRLDAQPLIALQVRAHKQGRPDRESDQGVAFLERTGATESAPYSAVVFIRSCKLDHVVHAMASNRSGPRTTPPGTGCVRWHTDAQSDWLYPRSVKATTFKTPWRRHALRSDERPQRTCRLVLPAPKVNQRRETRQ